MATLFGQELRALTLICSQFGRSHKFSDQHKSAQVNRTLFDSFEISLYFYSLALAFFGNLSGRTCPFAH